MVAFGNGVCYYVDVEYSNGFIVASRYLEIYIQQECIPVGCVPSAAVAVSGGGGVPGPGRGVYLVLGGSTWSPGDPPGPGTPPLWIDTRL